MSGWANGVRYGLMGSEFSTVVLEGDGGRVADGVVARVGNGVACVSECGARGGCVEGSAGLDGG